MFFKAAEDLNIDLSESYMIGDGENDMKAGKAAGCRTIRMERNGDLLKALEEVEGIGK